MSVILRFFVLVYTFSPDPLILPTLRYCTMPEWLKEPTQRLGVSSKEAKRRHWRLGNMCVPQCSKLAYDILTARLVR